MKRRTDVKPGHLFVSDNLVPWCTPFVCVDTVRVLRQCWDQKISIFVPLTTPLDFVASAAVDLEGIAAFFLKHRSGFPDRRVFASGVQDGSANAGLRQLGE
jgi:hypothetical protein